MQQAVRSEHQDRHQEMVTIRNEGLACSQARGMICALLMCTMCIHWSVAQYGSCVALLV